MAPFVPVVPLDRVSAGETLKNGLGCSQQNKAGPWQTRGSVWSWPMTCQPGRRSPSRRAEGAAGRRWVPPSPPPTAPALPPRPAPLPDARRERGPGWHLPTRPARYLSRHLSGADLRGAGGPGNPAASPAPPAPGGVPSPPLPAAPPAPVPGPAPGESPRGLRFAPGPDGIRCQRGGQAPPVGGAKRALTRFPPPPPPARGGAILRAPRRLRAGRPAGV